MLSCELWPMAVVARAKKPLPSLDWVDRLLSDQEARRISKDLLKEQFFKSLIQKKYPTKN